MLNPGQEINNEGQLIIGGCSAKELAEAYGTPLYVMNETVIRNNMRAYKEAFDKYYGGNGRAYFASKAFCTLEMCRIAKSEGLGLDVVSGGELYTAMKAGFPAEIINFHGNNKTYNELKAAIEYGVGKIIVDNLNEFRLIDTIAGELNKKVSVSIRIKPGVEAHTHDYIKTGQIDSKFGFAIENGEALQAANDSLRYSNLSLSGVHCHIGSQIFDVQPFKDAAVIMLNFVKKLSEELNISIEELNLGGGFGIKYVDSDTPKPFEQYIEAVSETVKETCKELGMEVPFVSVEPGRSIVGEAGVTLYTVGGIKTIPNVRTYLSVDGGMTDNIRYALYKSDYTVINASRADKNEDITVTVAGKCCESGDLIQENVKLPKTEIGDILAVLSTGAYNYSMASNYNRIPRPAVVMVKDGTHRLIVRRESYEDIIRNDI
ncbi:MAG: diaminopimelate decarboxylase [Eubacteriales bacterium]|nr:diaminopimelate decarboxylase [Eubacteriales bacterium]